VAALADADAEAHDLAVPEELIFGAGRNPFDKLAGEALTLDWHDADLPTRAVHRGWEAHGKRRGENRIVNLRAKNLCKSMFYIIISQNIGKSARPRTGLVRLRSRVRIPVVA
jgi:hypothetical protein